MEIPHIIATILMFFALGICAMLLAKWIRLPLSLWMVLLGFLFSLTLPVIKWDTGVRASNFEDLMLFVLLPVLIFEAAFNLKLKLIEKFLPTITTLATLGLLVSTAITAVILFFGINHAGFPIIAALLAGSVISATDPVAVVNQLKQLRAPEELNTLIEGESLFNDATAIVLFTILMGVALDTSEPDMLSGFVTFLKVFFGGISVGVAMGFAFVLLQKILAHDAVSHALFTIVLAYGSFYIAEHLFDVSGVMAVLLAALVYRNTAELHSVNTYHNLHSVWQLLASVANLFVFVLLGLVISLDMFEDRWLAMLIGIVAATIARLVTVYFCVGITNVLGNKISWKYPPIMWWGGLRGAVTVALVLSLPTELPYWYTIQSIGFGVVLFTLVVQANTAGLMFKKLGIKNGK